MPDIKNCVAVDWRYGNDSTYFFFKDTNQYSLFSNGQNKVKDGYPAKVTHETWNTFHDKVKDLRFGFNFNEKSNGPELLLLFYDDAGTPSLCLYHEEWDRVIENKNLADTNWAKLTPYFYKILFGAWWTESDFFGGDDYLLFVMNDGNYLRFNHTKNTLDIKEINNNTWPGVAPYKNEIVTAVQFNRSPSDDMLYIFLTENRYIKYNIDEDKPVGGVNNVDNASWPGLLRN
jgi:hypothetical protein